MLNGIPAGRIRPYPEPTWRFLPGGSKLTQINYESISMILATAISTKTAIKGQMAIDKAR